MQLKMKNSDSTHAHVCLRDFILSQAHESVSSMEGKQI